MHADEYTIVKNVFVVSCMFFINTNGYAGTSTGAPCILRSCSRSTRVVPRVLGAWSTTVVDLFLRSTGTMFVRHFRKECFCCCVTLFI